MLTMSVHLAAAADGEHTAKGLVETVNTIVAKPNPRRRQAFVCPHPRSDGKAGETDEEHIKRSEGRG